MEGGIALSVHRQVCEADVRRIAVTFLVEEYGVPFILSAPSSSGDHLAHIQRTMDGIAKLDSQLHSWRSSRMSKVILIHLHMSSRLVQGKLQRQAIGCEV